MHKKVHEFVIKSHKHVFLMYFEKYVNKYTKYMRQNQLETPDLIPFIESNQNEIDILMNFIQINRQEIMNNFQKVNLSNITRCKRDANDELIFKFNKIFVAFKTIDQTWLYKKFTSDVSHFALVLHKGIYENEQTAKQKVVEHWIERLPIVIGLSFTTLLLKLSKFYFFNNLFWDGLDIFTHCYVFIVIIYMVYLRVPQCIFADAKQRARCQYIEFKTNLYSDLKRTSNASLF